MNNNYQRQNNFQRENNYQRGNENQRQNNYQRENDYQRRNDNQRGNNTQRRNNNIQNIDENSENSLCTFYQKIGACRHGQMCVRKHFYPTFSRTILIPQMYQNPRVQLKEKVSSTIRKELQNHLDTFYKDIFYELMKYGEIEELMVSDNLTPHLLGHVYAKYVSDIGAARAFKALQNRWYNQTTLKPEFSTVVNFYGARCRQNDRNRNGCDRGDYCNFLHIRDPSPDLLRQLYDDQQEYYKDLEREVEKLSHKNRYSDEELSDEEYYKSRKYNKSKNDLIQNPNSNEDN
ncbi:u2 small nuclear RNA auxiliary factor [Anaeramoeba flamelloides]|uniref:U2 small nuclear RNA auxiliary factor n=1 Tax=Anaeramoeba flamelloides TaxID=1746091 RepID=A0AAV7YI60_9EUKA|nr:u2 small nuclear RNA auxiliary factor [Anaeramoeba flamelloides]